MGYYKLHHHLILNNSFFFAGHKFKSNETDLWTQTTSIDLNYVNEFQSMQYNILNKGRIHDKYFILNMLIYMFLNCDFLKYVLFIVL